MSKNQTTEEVKPVLLSALTPSPVNERDVKKSVSYIAELAKNIDSIGLIHPIVVRPTSSGGGNYEIVVGECRYEAYLKLNKTYILASIRDLSDHEAYELTAAENLMREDLTPMQEAKSIKTLLDLGKDWQEIADRMGKSKQWLVRRAKLTNLDKSWVKMMENEDSPICNWSGAHFELIARYSKKRQKEILEGMDSYCVSFPEMSAKDFSEYLNKDVLLMEYAPWNLDDKTLNNKSCVSCNVRSSCEPDLFDSVTNKKGQKKDYCLDKECWGKKLVAFHNAKIPALKEKHDNLILIDNSGYNSIDMLPADHPFQEELKPSHNYLDCKKSDKEAIPAYVVDGPGKGKIRYMKQYSYNDYSSSGGPRSSGDPVPMAERKKALQKRRVLRFITKIIQLLAGEEPKHLKAKEEPVPLSPAEWSVPGQQLTHHELFALITGFGCTTNFDYNAYDCRAFKMHKEISALKESEAFGLVLKGVMSKISDELHSLINQRQANKKFADEVCRVLYLDKKALWNKVLSEIKEPKVWATLNADGTKKTGPSKKESEKVKKSLDKKLKEQNETA